MYLFFRCDCGRVLVAEESSKTRECPCGKKVKIKGRRVLRKCVDSRDIPLIVQELQSELYQNTGFISADKL